MASRFLGFENVPCPASVDDLIPAQATGTSQCKRAQQPCARKARIRSVGLGPRPNAPLGL